MTQYIKAQKIFDSLITSEKVRETFRGTLLAGLISVPDNIAKAILKPENALVEA